VLAALLGFVVGYFLGSIPTAYLVVSWFSHTDIRRKGSGNVGALNSYTVTGSRPVALLVLAFDILKGVAAVLIPRYFFGDIFAISGAASVGAVLGHNYPVWLGFRGGRGLATSAAVMFLHGWIFVPVWGAFWWFSYVLLRSINPANALATALWVVALFVVPWSLWETFVRAGIGEKEFTVFVTALALIILSRHVEPMRGFITAIRQRKVGP
jgi:glycerol-3-phosphate acyltransferase PlsY